MKRINTDHHASLVEIAYRARRSLDWVQAEAIGGRMDTATRHPVHGWIVDRVAAEGMIRDWLEK